MPTSSASARDLSAIACELAVALPALTRVLDRRIAEDLPHPEPSKGQLALLRLVEERDGITVREAAEILLMKSNNVSALVSQLTDNGLLERRQDPADKRVAHLHLTAESRRRVGEIKALMEGYFAEALRTLNEGELAALGSAVSALRTLTRRVHPAV